MSKFINSIDWFKDDNKQAFRRVEKSLLSKGFTLEESDDILQELYYAVCSEYGE